MGKTNRKMNENGQKNRAVRERQRQKMKNNKKIKVNEIEYDDEYNYR